MPQFRSFKRTYGGDPDTSVLRDLHKRVMRLEMDSDREHVKLDRLASDIGIIMARLDAIASIMSQQFVEESLEHGGNYKANE